MASTVQIRYGEVNLKDLLYFEVAKFSETPKITLHYRNKPACMIFFDNHEEQDIHENILSKAISNYQKQQEAPKDESKHECKSATAKEPVKPKYYKFVHRDAPFTFRIDDIAGVRYQNSKLQIILANKTTNEEFTFSENDHGKNIYNELVALLN